MKIKLIYVGKTGKSFLEDGENEYLKRLKRYVPFEIIELPDIKNTKKRSFNEIRYLEAESILSKIQNNDFVILLDEKGQQPTSKGFSEYLQKKFNQAQDIVFVIGGPYGFDDKMYNRANDKISLSNLTFSHQMIRMFFLEQVYRALTILNNEPYHHE